jgi:DNA-binding response OmpR family regulator
MLTFLRRLFGVGENQWPSIPFEEIRKRSRLLVIDDQEFPYLPLFRRDGYNIEKWSDVQRLTDLQDGRYDLILLDLQGVGRQESHEQQGFGILRHLREQYPTLLVVAYSNADWSLKYQEFFALADSVLPKTADYVDFKARVDDLLKTRFSLGFYVNRILDEARRLDLDEKRLESLSRQAISQRDLRRLRVYLHDTHASPAAIDRVLSIVNSAIGIITAWAK